MMNRCPKCKKKDTVLRGNDKEPNKCSACGHEWPSELEPESSERESMSLKNPKAAPRRPDSLFARSLNDALSDI
jgi:hypothetical protein